MLAAVVGDAREISFHHVEIDDDGGRVQISDQHKFETG